RGRQPDFTVELREVNGRGSASLRTTASAPTSTGEASSAAREAAAPAPTTTSTTSASSTRLSASPVARRRFSYGHDRSANIVDIRLQPGALLRLHDSVFFHVHLHIGFHTGRAARVL